MGCYMVVDATCNVQVKGQLSFLCYAATPATGHVHGFSIPDSFMYAAIGYVPNIFRHDT